MKTSDERMDISMLPRVAADDRGEPTLPSKEAVALVRRHIDLEKLKTFDYDSDLWQLWKGEVGRAVPDATNEDILEMVLLRVREGE